MAISFFRKLSFRFLTISDIKIIGKKIIVGWIVSLIPLIILAGGLFLIIRLLQP